jgi:DNA modification methylase
MKQLNKIICGDNLEMLREIPSESVDLCYIDPPFFTSRNYEVIWNDGEELRQFGDRWVTENKDGSGRASKDINVYLEFMEPRIREIYRVLKPTGSYYVHCDWHADSYLRVLCDKIFGYDKLQGKIVWERTKTASVKGAFKNNYDSILYYTKSSNYTFNTQYEELMSQKGFKEDEFGSFADQPCIQNGLNNGDNKRYFPLEKREIILPDDKKWLISQETIDLGEGFIWTKGGNPRRKRYLKDGKPCSSIWLDMIMHNSSKERLGYPTQKPEALLERIIQASSNKGDIVLDAFCGCGTTLAVAKKLKRQFIGIDVSPTACRLVANRIKVRVDSIIGLPLTADEISQLDGFEFQNWVIREFGGFSGKRGADGGIDGKLGDCPIQVKKYKAGRNDLDQFSGAMLRENTKEGIYLALDFSSDFKKEVARLKRANDILIYYFTVKDILDKLHYPILDEKLPKHGLDKYNKKD